MCHLGVFNISIIDISTLFENINIKKDILENISIDIEKDILGNMDKAILENVNIDKDIFENIDINIDKVILENVNIHIYEVILGRNLTKYWLYEFGNIDIDIDIVIKMTTLETIDIDKGLSQNIDIDRKSHRLRIWHIEHP